MDSIDGQLFLFHHQRMSDLHVPVMLHEILEFYSETILGRGESQSYFDGTFGRGGHLHSVMQKYPDLKAVAFDRDSDAIKFGQEKFAAELAEKRLQFFHKNYSEYDSGLHGMFDVGLLDLGVSSPQLDQSQRGFSFMHDGPMDMRMNQAEEITAQKLLQECAEDELIELFTKYGEIYRPQRVVRAIIADRSKKDFSSTLDFANMVARIEGWRRKGYHPATQYFQALRIAVNGELRHLENALLPLLHGLKPKGRLAVLTFHSLEDRIVKNCFKSLPDFGRPLTKKVVKTSWQESKENSRARSAKLRVFERSETRGEKR